MHRVCSLAIKKSLVYNKLTARPFSFIQQYFSQQGQLDTYLTR